MADFESNLLTVPKVYVFDVPKLVSAEGHRASSWGKEPKWNGRLRVTSKGNKINIVLEDDADGVHAVCPVNEKTLEPVTDSSRYFVLRCTDQQGRNAHFLGLGFNDRAVAFDFKVAVQDALNQNSEKKIKPEKHVDLSIPQGGKIHVNLGAKSSSSSSSSSSSKSSSSSSSSSSSTSSLISSVNALSLTEPEKKKKKKKKKKEEEEEEEEGQEETPEGWVSF